ncbi:MULTISPECIES: hypothetical protein [Nocardia]|uniref:SnoaL-like domain-containing protein n=1 Tax=Nocardia implantans TaxID=3108168 RepID=A0ABU6AP57_9NOCA|nr:MULTISPECIES: hypothetical protein [unclassified Nocardia]MBF6189603.1 hypothetical protein [Nocardia beijingensis]MEA3527169.1 hypothetical protein [Nocardia sp. CDC192]MEB3509253.1 hypothetical protein [Nocardia sp. CDC186]
MSKTLDEQELSRFAERYIALWNEPDAEARHERVRQLWAEDGAQVLVDPPQAMREALARLSFPIPTVEIRGYEALDRRVDRAYEEFVAPGDHMFVPEGPAIRLSVNLIGLTWHMVTKADGAVVGGGYDVIALDDAGRIRWDHQYIGVA